MAVLERGTFLVGPVVVQGMGEKVALDILTGWCAVVV